MTKWVLITGCSSGIGYVCAHALQKEGFQVIASCRQLSDVERLRQEGLTCIHLDLADSESISRGVEEALKLSQGKLYGWLIQQWCLWTTGRARRSSNESA